MNKFFEGLVQRLKDNPINLVYDMIIFIMVALLVVGLTYVYLYIRRWYNQSLLRREGEDFQAATDYSVDTGRKLNLFQRLLLSQVGFVVTMHFFLASIFGMAMGIVLTLMFVHFFSDNLMAVRIMYAVLAIGCAYYVKSMFPEFKKHARMVPFFFFLGLFCAMVILFLISFSEPLNI
jgi:hypothetical protein